MPFGELHVIDGELRCAAGAAQHSLAASSSGGGAGTSSSWLNSDPCRRVRVQVEASTSTPHSSCRRPPTSVCGAAELLGVAGSDTQRVAAAGGATSDGYPFHAPRPQAAACGSGSAP